MTFDAQNHERVDRWLANLAREANHAVIVQDLLGRIVSWNEGASKMYGYTNEESFEMPINALIPNAMREGHRDRIEQTLRHGYTEPFETTRRTRTGEILDVFVEITLLRDKSGQPESVATVERDISQQRLHEGQIQKMEERATELNEAAEVLLYELNEASTEVERKEGLINGILEGAADGIITFDPAGRIDTCNNSANRIFGYSAGETIGMEVGALIPAEGLGSPLGALQGPIDGLLAESGPAMDALEATGWRSSGESFPLTYSVSELK
ncbi:MAG: PAS domain S-box-containing protein, partial [Candidatus Paceibacteria bacterium]